MDCLKKVREREDKRRLKRRDRTVSRRMFGKLTKGERCAGGKISCTAIEMRPYSCSGSTRVKVAVELTRCVEE